MGCCCYYLFFNPTPSWPPELEGLRKEVTKKGDEISNQYLIEANESQKEKKI